MGNQQLVRGNPVKNLRRWQLDSNAPLTFYLAADARLSQTDYTDDQVWELLSGEVDSPALALQTKYGGRVGLASLVPMWIHDGRTIYQSQAYTEPPTITAFAPNYVRAKAEIIPGLDLVTEYWAMESHSVGGRFALRNRCEHQVKLRLNLFGHVGAKGEELKLGIALLRNKLQALVMGEFANLCPVVLLENGTSESPSRSTIGVDIELAPRKKTIIRWVHAGMPDLESSVSLAQRWLAQNWVPHLKQINQAALAIPIVQTGKREWDLAIAAAYQQLLQSFLKPTGNLPYGSFVATRNSAHGFSKRGDGSDYDRAWSGQEPTTTYPTALAIAPIDGQAAQGIVHNYLAIQGNDGSVDRKPGLGGQRQGMMCSPLLARLAWGIFGYTGDEEFLKSVFPRLTSFFERWFEDDLDTDGDGLPEWQSERQTGHVYMPTFAAAQSWGQGADIRTVEAPDMAAYLLSEADSLREMAQQLGKKQALKSLDKRIKSLNTLLENLWRDGRYVYRDRDMHTTTESVTVVDKGKGNEEHFPTQSLPHASRLIVRITGGVSHKPRITLTIDGLSENGAAISEQVGAKDFLWRHGYGVYTTQQVFAQVDRVYCDGLSRVFRLDVRTVDTSRLDINALTPLWANIPAERADELVTLLTDKKNFWRPNGVTMVSAQDSHFDPSNADGGGAVWPYWFTLIGEGLLAHGYGEDAADMLKDLLNTQAEVLKQHRCFTEFYHSDEAVGLGEKGHLGGIVPLHLLMGLIGVQIVSGGEVRTGGPFAWGRTVTIKQHGVTVRRKKSGIEIRFPSGHKVQLDKDAKWQAVVDPNPVIAPSITPIELPPPKRSRRKPAIIKVQHED